MTTFSKKPPSDFHFLRKGELIFHQNEPFKGYFLVKSGIVRTSRVHDSGTKTILSFKIPGEYLGEIIETDLKKNYSYSAYATDDQTVLEFIPWEDPSLFRLLRILENLQSELLQARVRLERFIEKDSEERIRLTLKDLATRMGKKFGSETLLKLPVTHEDLATLTDTSRQTVTMVLSRLKAQNIISYSRGRFLFRNLDSL
jgi:CRP/FNR family transcriptional regulator